MKKHPTVLSLLVSATLLAACQDVHDPIGVEPAFNRGAHAAPAPAPLVSVTAGSEALTFWPYTGSDFSTVSDPINLIFVGEADPRSIRAALLALDGNRAPQFPNVFPFNCTWKDAVGGAQTSYSEAEGWTGSEIQLECGDYAPIRFHIRFFQAGEWTLANAHLDVLIPGTNAHEVVAWEMAERFVAFDVARTGLLAAAPLPTAQIHPAPTFRTMNPLIYFSPALNALRPFLGAVVYAPANVGIGTDGRATILRLGAHVASPQGTTAQAFTIQFNQVIPKPFCNTGNDWVLVQGPIEVTMEVGVSGSGNFSSFTFASGELMVTPFDPVNRVPLGAPRHARVREQYHSEVTDHARFVDNARHQQIETSDGPAEQLKAGLRVGPNGLTRYSSNEKCGA
jgi:hypothetical protein